MGTDKAIENARKALLDAQFSLEVARKNVSRALELLEFSVRQNGQAYTIGIDPAAGKDVTAITISSVDGILVNKQFQSPDSNPQPEPIEEEITITEEWKLLLDKMNNGNEPLFITGPAGTGKSTLLNYFAARFEQSFAIVAPTGVAALRVGGQTIHSFFRFPIHALDEHDTPDIPPKFRAKYKALHTLIIDEISMVRADMMDAIDLFLRKYGPLNDVPFGGVRLIMIGDPYQLPPVSRDKTEKQWLKSRYGSDCPFFFQALVWQKVAIDKHELTTIFRQTDPAFTGVLNAARSGLLSEKDIALLNSRVQPGFRPELDDMWITLTTTNDAADYANRRMLDQLPGQGKVFTASLFGEFDEKNAPTDINLRLKVGAIVMFVKNSPNHYWVNGTLGKVTSLDPLQVKPADGTGEYEVEAEEWEQIAYEYDNVAKRLNKRVKGSFEQIPLRLAAAITIHKSQGLTLDRTILDLSRGAFADGQAYVGFSRCRTLNGIVLRAPVTPGDFMVNADVRNFMAGKAVVLPAIGNGQMSLLESRHA